MAAPSGGPSPGPAEERTGWIAGTNDERRNLWANSGGDSRITRSSDDRMTRDDGEDVTRAACGRLVRWRWPIRSEVETMVVEAKAPNLLLRVLWFVLVGWWLTAILSAVAWFLNATIIGLP